MGLLALLLQFAPQAINAGIALEPVIKDALSKSGAAGGRSTGNAVEDFAAKALQYVPTAIAAGIATTQVVQVLNDANKAVQRMIAENRGPTDAELNAQDARIKSLEDQLDAAGKAPGAGGTAG